MLGTLTSEQSHLIGVAAGEDTVRDIRDSDEENLFGADFNCISSASIGSDRIRLPFGDKNCDDKYDGFSRFTYQKEDLPSNGRLEKHFADQEPVIHTFNHKTKPSEASLFERETLLLSRERVLEQDLNFLERQKDELARLRALESEWRRKDHKELKQDRLETRYDSEFTEKWPLKPQSKKRKRIDDKSRATLTQATSTHDDEDKYHELNPRLIHELKSLRCRLNLESKRLEEEKASLAAGKAKNESRMKRIEDIRIDFENKLVILDSREERLATYEEELNHERSRLDRREHELEIREKSDRDLRNNYDLSLSHARSEHDRVNLEQRQKIEVRTRKLEELEVKAETRMKHLEAQEVSLASREKALKALQSLQVQVREEQFKLDTGISELKSRAIELDNDKSKFRTERGTVEELSKSIESLKQELYDARKRIHDAEALCISEQSVCERAKLLSEKLAALGEDEVRLSAKEQDLDSRELRLKRSELQCENEIKRSKAKLQEAEKAEKIANDIRDSARIERQKYEHLQAQVNLEKKTLASCDKALLNLDERKRQLQGVEEEIARKTSDLRSREEELVKEQAIVHKKREDVLVNAKRLLQIDIDLKKKHEVFEFQQRKVDDNTQSELNRITERLQSESIALSKEKESLQLAQDMFRKRETELGDLEENLRSRCADMEDKQRTLELLEKQLTGERNRFLEQQQELEKQCEAWQNEHAALQTVANHALEQLRVERERVQAMRDEIEADRKEQNVLMQKKDTEHAAALSREAKNTKELTEKHLQDMSELENERVRLAAMKERLEDEKREIDKKALEANEKFRVNLSISESLASREAEVVNSSKNLTKELELVRAERDNLMNSRMSIAADRKELDILREKLDNREEAIKASERKTKLLEEELLARETSLDTQLSAVATQLETIDSDRNDYFAKSQEIKLREDELSDRLKQFNERANALSEKEVDLERREECLRLHVDKNKSAKALDEFRKGFSARAKRLEESVCTQTKKFKQERDYIARKAVELKKLEQILVQQKKQLEQYSGAVATRVQWLESENQECMKRRSELDSYEARLEQENRKLRKKEKTIKRQQEKIAFLSDRLVEREKRCVRERNKDRKNASKLAQKLEACGRDFAQRIKRERVNQSDPNVVSTAKRKESPNNGNSDGAVQVLFHELQLLRKNQESQWKQDLDELDKAQRGMEERFQKQALEMSIRQKEELSRFQEQLRILQKKENESMPTTFEKGLEKGNEVGNGEENDYDRQNKIDALRSHFNRVLNDFDSEQSLLNKRQKHERELLKSEQEELRRQVESERQVLQEERASVLEMDKRLVENFNSNVREKRSDPDMGSNEAIPGKSQSEDLSSGTEHPKNLIDEALEELAHEKEKLKLEITSRVSQQDLDRKAMEEERKTLDMRLEQHRAELEAKFQSERDILRNQWQGYIEQVQDRETSWNSNTNLASEPLQWVPNERQGLRNSNSLDSSKLDVSTAHVSPSKEGKIVTFEIESPRTSVPSDSSLADTLPTDIPAAKVSMVRLPNLEKDKPEPFAIQPTSMPTNHPLAEVQSFSPLLVARARSAREELASAIIRKENSEKFVVDSSLEVPDADLQLTPEENKGEKIEIDDKESLSKQRSDQIHPSPIEDDENEVIDEQIVPENDRMDDDSHLFENQKCQLNTVLIRGQTVLEGCKATMQRLQRLSDVLVPLKSESLIHGLSGEVCSLSKSTIQFLESVQKWLSTLSSKTNAIEASEIEKLFAEAEKLIEEQASQEERFRKLLRHVDDLVQLDEKKNQLLRAGYVNMTEEIVPNAEGASSAAYDDGSYAAILDDGPSSYQENLNNCMKVLQKSLNARDILLHQTSELTPISSQGFNYCFTAQVDPIERNTLDVISHQSVMLKSGSSLLEGDVANGKSLLDSIAVDESLDLNEKKDENSIEEPLPTNSQFSEDHEAEDKPKPWQSENLMETSNGIPQSDEFDIAMDELGSIDFAMKQHKRSLNLRLQRLSLEMAMVEGQDDASTKLDALRLEFNKIQAALDDDKILTE